MGIPPNRRRRRQTAREIRTAPVASEAEVAATIEDNLPAPIGHNEPPRGQIGMTDEEWSAWINHVFEAVDARALELLASFTRFEAGFPVIQDDSVQGRAGDLKDKIQALVKQAEALHTIEKAPILLASKAVDGKLRGFRGQFLELDSKGRMLPRSNAPLNVITARQTEYVTRKVEESRRIAAADAQRLADEAAAAADAAAETMNADDLQDAAAASQAADKAATFAAAPAADHARTYGPMGSVTTARGYWRFYPDESDLMALARSVVAGETPLAYLAFNETRIGVAVRTERVREIPGCVIKHDLTAQ